MLLDLNIVFKIKRESSFTIVNFSFKTKEMNQGNEMLHQ